MQLSICMMVKNEENNLERCLNSLKYLMNAVESELIIIDTGSTDKTVDISKKYTEKVFFHPWDNNFSEMRNKSISYAKGEWLFIIDADEELFESAALIEVLKSNPKGISAIALELENIISSNGRKGSKITTMRLFKNDGHFRYEGVVHNMPVVKGRVLKIDALIYHYGYIADDAQLMQNKFDRTSTLLKQELEKNPSNIYYLFQLGTSYDMYNDNKNAIIYFDKAYQLICNDMEQLKEHFYMMGSYAKELIYDKQYAKAIEITRVGLNIKPDYIDLMYFGGISSVIEHQYTDGIKLLGDYLKYIDCIKNTEIYNNPNVQLYTLNSKDEVMLNLAIAYNKVQQFDESLHYTKQLLIKLDENSEYYERSVNVYIHSTILSKKYNLIAELYDIVSKSRAENVDCLVYHSLVNESSLSKLEICSVIAKLPSNLGIVFENILSKNNLNNKVKGILLETFLYYIANGISEILLFALDDVTFFKTIAHNVEESKIMSCFGELNENYGLQLISKIKRTIDSINDINTFQELYIKRLLVKTLAILLWGTEESDKIFDAYIELGINQMILKYKREFIMGLHINQLLNSEEHYFMNLINIIDNYDISLISETLNIFPEYNKITLNWLENKLDKNKESNNIAENKQFSDLLFQLKSNIDFLHENGNNSDALSLIEEYLRIDPSNIEMILLQSELMLSNKKN